MARARVPPKKVLPWGVDRPPARPYLPRPRCPRGPRERSRWSHRLARPRTPGFHPGDRGSNPLGITTLSAPSERSLRSRPPLAPFVVMRVGFLGGCRLASARPPRGDLLARTPRRPCVRALTLQRPERSLPPWDHHSLRSQRALASFSPAARSVRGDASWILGGMPPRVGAASARGSPWGHNSLDTRGVSIACLGRACRWAGGQGWPERGWDCS